ERFHSVGFPDIHKFPESHPGPYERQMGEIITRLLALFKGRAFDSESHAHVMALAESPARWSAGHRLFDEIRGRLLAANDKMKRAKYEFEESCLQAMYNASQPPDPFDPTSAFFVVGNAIGLARALGVPVDTVLAIVMPSF